jgi:hypothetical protein
VVSGDLERERRVRAACNARRAAEGHRSAARPAARIDSRLN